LRLISLVAHPEASRFHQRVKISARVVRGKANALLRNIHFLCAI
jgi:hypothetical protein